MTKEQAKAYLERIGLQDAAPDEEGLASLIWAHLTHVPFENLTVTEEGEVPSLEEEALFEKVVNRRRGGYCFELNRAFYLLLQALGFEAWPVGVRIIWNRSELPAIMHRATVVRIKEKRYLADVGFGGPGPKGLLELSDREQKIRGDVFRAIWPGEGLCRVEKLYQGEFAPMFLFEEHPFEEVDFAALNFYCARCEKVLFSSRRVMCRCTEEGLNELNGELLKITRNGVTKESSLGESPEDRARIKKLFFV